MRVAIDGAFGIDINSIPFFFLDLRKESIERRYKF